MSDAIHLTRDIARQTPDSSFGHALSQAGSAVVRLAGSMNPVLSAALDAASNLNQGRAGTASNAGSHVSGLGQGIVSTQRSISAQTAVPSAGAATTGTTAASTTTSGDPNGDLLAAQQSMNLQNQSFQMQYLQLQDTMQQQSQQFTAISNIMKVRYDCAKTAINNIH